MSLINQMLADLEARKGGSLRSVDAALEGLHAAPTLRLALAERPRVVLAALLAVVSLAALWASREPLHERWRVPVVPSIARVKLAEPTAPTLGEPAPPLVPATEIAPAVLAAPAPGPVVVLEAPPSDALAPETFNMVLPAQQADTPPRAPTVSAAPADLASIYLAPETGEEIARPAAAPRAVMPVLPRVATRPDAEPTTVEYPGSFHREQSTATPVSPQARQRAEIDALFANGRREAAMHALRNFVLATPADEVARERLALELVIERRATEAEALLRAGLRRAPASTRLAEPLGHLLLGENRAAAALAALRPATPPLAGHPEFHALLAAAEQRTGAHGLAITRYRGLLKEQPLNGSWLVGLGISLLAVDEQADAAASFARALDDRALPEPLRAYATRELVRLKERAR